MHSPEEDLSRTKHAARCYQMQLLKCIDGKQAILLAIAPHLN